jgi:hypothetical protein
MVWDPAIPATNADLLSAPVRDNFGALDTALMAALATLANGAVLTKAAGPVIAGVLGMATGAVLASAGVNTAPVWSVSPALTDLKLGGGTIGTSGVGVLAIGPSTAPTTSPVDTVQLYTRDFVGEGGSRGLELRDERGGTINLVSHSSGTYVRLTNPAGSHQADFVVGPTANVSIGSVTNTPVHLITNNIAVVTIGTNGGLGIGRTPTVTGLDIYRTTRASMRLDSSGGHSYDIFVGGTGDAGLGSWHVFNNTTGRYRLVFTSDDQTYLSCAGQTNHRLVMQGAIDSGGAGYRQLIIANS